jgi:hypothetical protein
MVEDGIDAECQQACHKKTKNDAADDAAPACDQPEAGDSSSGHGQGNGSPERTRRRRCSSGHTRGRGGVSGELPAPRTLLRLVWHQHPFRRDRNGNPLHNTCLIGSICVWQINVRVTLPVGRIACAILHKRPARIGFASRIVLSVVWPSVLSGRLIMGRRRLVRSMAPAC